MPLTRWAAALCALLVVVPAAPARAEPGWSVQPAATTGQGARNYFVYDLAPGRQITDTVRVTNRDAGPLTFTVYGTDAYTTTDGAFDLLPASRPPVDVGSWIVFGAKAYTVPAGRHLDIPFRLTVPTNASPGDHAGGVIASVVSQQTGGDGQQVTVDRRIAARVYLRVPGATRPSVLAEAVTVAYDNPAQPFAGGAMAVTYQLRNTGNLRVAGVARVRLTGPFGLGLGRTADVAVPELLPGAAVTVTDTVTGVAPALRLTAHVEVEPATADGRLPTVVRSASVWAVPWTVLAVLVLLAAVVVVLRWRRRRARRAA